MQDVLYDIVLKAIDFVVGLVLLLIGGIGLRWITDRYERIKYTREILERLLDLYQEFYNSFNNLHFRWVMWTSASDGEFRKKLSEYLMENSISVIIQGGVFFGKLGLYLHKKVVEEEIGYIDEMRKALTRIGEISSTYYPPKEVPEELIKEFNEKADSIRKGLVKLYEDILALK